MVIFNSGFLGENYVGTYEIKEIGNFNKEKVIISKEFRNPKNNEEKLLKKTLFTHKFKNGRYISLEFSNINIKDNNSIINFCNTYGLPFSSALMADKGLPQADDFYLFYTKEQLEKIPYYNGQDKIGLFEFCRHYYSIRRILNIKSEIETKTKTPKIMFENLLSLLLYEKMYTYDLDINDYKAPNTSTAFHYYFLLIQKKFKTNFSKIKFKTSLFNFFVEALNNTPNYIKYINSQYVISHKIWTKIYDLLFNIITIIDSNTLANITVDEYGNIHLPDEKILDEKIVTKLYELAPQILIDFLNDHMSRVNPKLNIGDDGKIYSEWEFSYLYDAMILEILLMISSNDTLKKCANPTCGNFFAPNWSHSNKIYCNKKCADIMVKRRQRQRDKENPNRERLKPKFQSRKKSD